MSLEILGEHREKIRWFAHPSGCSPPSPQNPGEPGNQTFEICCLYRQPMIRLRSCRRRRALDHIQTIHRRVWIAAAGEVADVFHVAGESGVEKVGGERDDYVGLFEIVARLDRLAEG